MHRTGAQPNVNFRMVSKPEVILNLGLIASNGRLLLLSPQRKVPVPCPRYPYNSPRFVHVFRTKFGAVNPIKHPKITCNKLEI